jgi:hypothetical protein
MSLEALRITECPLAFASFAEKHNAIVDLLSQIRGANGVTVTISERNGIITGGGSASGNTDLTALTARVAALESSNTTLSTLTSGLSRQTVTYCDGGSNTIITILRS